MSCRVVVMEREHAAISGSPRGVETSQDPWARQPLPRWRDGPPGNHPACPAIGRVAAQKNPPHGGAIMTGVKLPIASN
jgi:hypothetical protein